MVRTPDWSGLTGSGDDAGGQRSPSTDSSDASPGAASVSKRRSNGRDAGDADPEAAARAIVLRQLTGSAKSRRQLEEKLARRDIPAAAAGAVLDRFEELQLVDDEAFAQAWVRSRAHSRGLAASALRRELREKGIAPELADRALEQLTVEDELASARDLAQRKLRSVPPSADRDKAVRRIVGMLGRKGYGPSMAFRVANEAWDEHGGS
ncbi:regulatory protein RecX [Arthrobacter sp. KK5.5]|uniref:regulatory protein RecX n=1 Tax=Arthrobacter sp. KK5.5 TaxID=3373084 RepID=UPI003EE50E86